MKQINKDNIIYEYDNNTNQSKCTILYDNNHFIGYAYCHKDDYDMASEKTGMNIAQMRATIKFYKYIKKQEILPYYMAYKTLYNNMEHSSKFNKQSYEAGMLRRQLHFYKNDLDTINDIIDTLYKNLRSYINEKESFYQKIRRGRK